MRSLGLKTFIVALAGATSVSGAPDTTWTQWGGPRRNFMIETSGLASSWSASGPKQLWSRSLGEGHSSIVAEGGRLYTMYRPAGLLSYIRRSQSEVIVAIDASNGTTIWEHTYAASTSGMDLGFGAGPHSTPLIVGNRLFAMSSRTEIVALDKQTGKLLWSHDLLMELGAPLDGRGYSSSPLAYRDTVIVPVGAQAASVVAFNQQTGAVRWKGGNFPTAHASPILINVDGQEQLVVSGAQEIVGMNPMGGAVLWARRNKTDYGLNISTPVWSGSNELLISAAYNNMARLLKLSQSGGKTTVVEQWSQNGMRTHIGTIIRLGDFAVASSGDFGPCPTVAVDIPTGRVLWRNRDFARSTFVHADGKLVIMDEDGNLGLAIASRSGLNVLARASILSNKSWTPPTLVGTKLYVRDRAKMIALELGS